MKIRIFSLIMMATLGLMSVVFGSNPLKIKDRPVVIIDDFQVNDDTSNAHQNYPRIAVDGLGNFVIVWGDGRNDEKDIYAQRYDSNGVALGDNFRVNDDASGLSQLTPDVAMDYAGNFVIAWDDRRNGGWDIYAQRYNPGGEPQGENFKVDDDTVGALQFYPSISVDYTGNFVIAWDDYRNPDSDIYAQRYNSSGEPQGENFRVNDDSPASAQGQSDVCIDSIGNFVITWMDWRSGFNIYAQMYNSSGVPEGVNFEVNDGPYNAHQYDPAISVEPAGNFVIAWEDARDGYDIFAQRFDKYGTKSGDNFKVNDDTTGASQNSPSLALDDSGKFVIVWDDNRNGDWDIFVQQYNQIGDSISVNFCVADTADTTGNNQNCPTVEIWNNKIYNTWMDTRTGRYCIWANVLKFDSSASVIQEETLRILSSHSFYLNIACPNPFNSVTKIEYQIPQDSWVSLNIYDVTGRLVKTLLDGKENYGHRSIYWDGRDNCGKLLPDGIYLCQMRAGEYQATKKVIVLR